MMGRVHEGYHVDEEYDHEYAVEVLVDPPTSKTIARFGSGSGTVLKVQPFDAPPFVFTTGARLSDLQLLSWPDPRSLLVLPGALLISTTDPGGSSRSLPGFDGHSVHYVRRFHSPNVAFIGHCCAIYCYDANGMRWAIDPLFDADPTIAIIGDDVILSSEEASPIVGSPIVVSLATGKLRR